MKKLTLSLLTVLALGGSTVAAVADSGGNLNFRPGDERRDDDRRDRDDRRDDNRRDRDDRRDRDGRRDWDRRDRDDRDRFDRRVVRCESRNFRLNVCNTRGRVIQARVARRISNRPCIQGLSWGVRGGNLWVSNGCRADFAVLIRR